MNNTILFDEICKMPVIDTHEHFPWNEEDRINDKNDVLGEYLSQYMRSDVISAGLKQDDFAKVINASQNIVERWKIIEPFWEYSRHTGYGRALDIAVKHIYGIDGVRGHTIEELNKAFLANKKPGHYKRVLQDLCNIETSLVDVWTFHIESKHPFFRAVWQPQNFINPGDSEPEGKNIFSHIEEKYKIKVKCLDDWLQALETEIDHILDLHGMRVLKSAIAYKRTLRFEKVKYGNAKALFSESLDKWDRGLKENPVIFPHELQDFMMHSVLSIANKHNLTFQLHTGILEGNGNILANSDPSHLNNLFLEYPNVDFDLFHISYPYQGVACALAKMFPNVFLDMCWAHIISPSSCVTALDDFLDAVPYNKISSFGGDYFFADGVYGHLYLSRQNISRVLMGKVINGVFDEGKALEIAKALYYDNPKRIFKL
jgi:predicted TIM-barrel fold metal-dependent hydrolase